jgi:hypothetical protein
MITEKPFETMALTAILAAIIANAPISPSSVFAQPSTSTTTATTTATNPFPQLPTPPSNNPSSIKMTSENKNTYTISSGSTRINNFVTTYTITGGINSIKSSSDLIVSTIIKDFDANANIGYVKNDLSSQTNTVQQQQKQQLPNPFVDKSVINQAISNAVNNVISSASVSYGGYLQIKCAFGMSLADYQCNSVPFTS